MSMRRYRSDPWRIRHVERPPDKRPPTSTYVARMPSAVDRVRFSRFIERALAAAYGRGMTAVEIEQATKIRLSTIHRWRRGEIAPGVDKVRQFCAGLAIPAAEALAALGVGPREVTPEAPMDPDVAALLRKLRDPNTSPETIAFIRSTLRYLVDLPSPAPRKARKAAG
jgi:transcriptional regulator with XRE-family HTH domain